MGHEKKMEISAKRIEIICVLVMGAATVWNCIATSLAMHIWFKPVISGFKIDAMSEIQLIRTILNTSLPVFAATLVVAIVLSARRNTPILALAVVSILFAASMAPALVFWQELVRAHSPVINLWENQVWWHFGH
jgi:hypothetical protein